MSLRTSATRLLESGDRMSQCEFHRRYVDSPEIKKAELVEGVVYVASPVSDLHADLHARMSGWLFAYRAHHPELMLRDNGTVILDGDNEVQPDLYLWRAGPNGPRLEGSYLVGAPQLIVEIAVSSVSNDLHDKLNAYRRSGVGEYVVWRALEQAIDWIRLNDGRYVLVKPDASGISESEVFPGLRLSIPAMLGDDMAGVLAALAAR